jgi:glycerol kinase
VTLCDRRQRTAFHLRTGLLLDAYFSGTKLAWLLDNVPGARERAKRGELAFGTVDTWLIWQLSGGRSHVTDVSNASRTLLFNIHTLDWDDELLALLDVPRAVLPGILPSSGTAATTGCDGLPTGLAVAGIAGDQQAALFGQACHSPGMAKNTYGTGCFLLMNTGSRPSASRNRLLTTVAWQRAGATTYALEGSVFIAGAAVQWLRDGLGIIERSADVRKDSRRASPTAPARTSCPRSPAWARRTGTRMHAAPWWESRAEPRARTSRARHSNRSPSRARS